MVPAVVLWSSTSFDVPWSIQISQPLAAFLLAGSAAAVITRSPNETYPSLRMR
jgi:hypothetical protein